MHFFFQCKSWNSSWSWNKLSLKNPLSFKNIRHLTLSMSTASLAIACEQALSGALEVGNGALFLSSPLQPPKEPAQRLYATRDEIYFCICYK